MSVSVKVRQTLMTNHLGGKKVLNLQFTHTGEGTEDYFFGQQLAVSRHIFICNQTQSKNYINCLFTVHQHVIIANFSLIGNSLFFVTKIYLSVLLPMLFFTLNNKFPSFHTLSESHSSVFPKLFFPDFSYLKEDLHSLAHSYDDLLCGCCGVN